MKSKKFERCVRKVKARDGVRNPWAVCHKSVGRDPKKKQAPKENYDFRGVCPFCRSVRLLHTESGLCRACLEKARAKHLPRESKRDPASRKEQLIALIVRDVRVHQALEDAGDSIHAEMKNYEIHEMLREAARLGFYAEAWSAAKNARRPERRKRKRSSRDPHPYKRHDTRDLVHFIWKQVPRDYKLQSVDGKKGAWIMAPERFGGGMVNLHSLSRASLLKLARNHFGYKG